MSVTSSLTPSIVENSCNTPLILIEVIAVPCKEESKTLLRALPSVVPKPFSRGSITTQVRRSSPESAGVRDKLKELVRKFLRIDWSFEGHPEEYAAYTSVIRFFTPTRTNSFCCRSGDGELLWAGRCRGGLRSWIPVSPRPPWDPKSQSHRSL